MQGCGKTWERPKKHISKQALNSEIKQNYIFKKYIHTRAFIFEIHSFQIQ